MLPLYLTTNHHYSYIDYILDYILSALRGM